MRNIIRMLVLALFASLIMWNICFADDKNNVTIPEKKKQINQPTIKHDVVLPRPDGTQPNPKVKTLEPNKNILYKDGEDGVNRVNPKNPLYKDGEDGVNRPLPAK